MKKLSLLIPILALCAPAGAAEPLSYLDLVQRLTSLEQLALLPAPGEKTAQWSSYDRKSAYDSTSGKYVNWDANGDGDGYIRKEGDQFVMAEMQGPGCIWRIWSAMPKQGRVRIYLDGANTPAVDLPFMGYFDGQNEPFNYRTLVHTTARGWNNYVPIPYQKSCKIVAEKDWGAYFQFVYQTFSPGTQVPTFSRELSAQEKKALRRADELLGNPNPGTERQEGEERIRKDLSLRPGSETVALKLKGPRAISALRVNVPLPSGPAARDVLRELAIQIRWDGEAEPSVWAPLGDFFGTTGANTYRSLPLGHTGDDWWYSCWYMPFAKAAEIRIANDGASAHKVTLEVAHIPVRRPIDELAYFHAKWHRDAFLPPEKERAIDWTMLTTTGAGRFAGVMLHIWNPRGSWWGEGDEKFHVDGERFPSTIGTGSEDYFGYAWCDPALFENAYHNQTQNDGNNKGHVTVNRWHIADNIPFHTNFAAYIEKYYPNNRPTLYASTVYWYLAPGGKDPYPALPVSERMGYWTPIETWKVKGALEGEKLKVLAKTNGNPHEQDLSGFGGRWSNDAHLWWIDAKPGDTLDLAVPIEKAGSYRVVMQLTKAPDYGTVQLYLDGDKLGQPIDLYHSSVVPTGELSFSTPNLDAGQHKLRVEIVGANQKAVKSYMFGLDYLKLETLQN